MEKIKIENQETLRNRVYKFVDLHPLWKKSAIVQHFMLEGVPRSTMYDILGRMANKIGPERKVGSGRKAIKMSNSKITYL